MCIRDSTEVVVNDTDSSGEDVLHSRSRSESGSIDGYDEDGGFQNNSRRGLGGGGSGLPVKVDAFGGSTVSANLVFRNPTELNTYPIQPPVQNYSAATPTVLSTPPRLPTPQLLQPDQLQQLQQLQHLQQLQDQLRQNPNIVRSNVPSPQPATIYPPQNSNPNTNPNTGTHTPSSEINSIMNQPVDANDNNNNNLVFTVVPDLNEDGAMM